MHHKFEAFEYFPLYLNSKSIEKIDSYENQDINFSNMPNICD